MNNFVKISRKFFTYNILKLFNACPKEFKVIDLVAHRYFLENSFTHKTQIQNRTFTKNE